MHSDLHQSSCISAIGSGAGRDDRNSKNDSKKTPEIDDTGRRPGKRNRPSRIKSLPHSRGKGCKTQGLMFPKTPRKKKRKKHPQSIIPGNQKGYCYICGRYCQTEDHHIFFGTGNRRNSEEYGLKADLCPECHRYGPNAAHESAETADYLHRIGQQAFEDQIGSREQFIEIFGRNYL